MAAIRVVVIDAVFVDRIDHVIEFADVHPVRPLASETRGQAFDHLANLIRLEKQARVQVVHEDAEVIDRAHQAGELKLQQRLANDALRDAETFGQLLLR